VGNTPFPFSNTAVNAHQRRWYSERRVRGRVGRRRNIVEPMHSGRLYALLLDISYSHMGFSDPARVSCSF